MPRKHDPGYSFRSSDFRSQPDRWQQPGRGRHDQPPPQIVPAEGRPCAQGPWCASAVTDPEGNRLPAPGPRAFCDRDRARIETALAGLPRLYACLGAEIGTPAQGSTPVRSPFGPRLPLRADIDAIMRLAEEVLVSWHERVAAVARLSFPEGRVRPGVAVSRAVQVLSPRLDALLALGPEPMRRAVSLDALAQLPEDAPGVVRSVYAAVHADLSGADAGLEILRVHRLARAALGETKARPEELLGVPCRNEECDMLALRRAELPSDPAAPAWWSECSACGDRMTEEEYRDWVRRYARWAQRRAPETLENLPGAS